MIRYMPFKDWLVFRRLVLSAYPSTQFFVIDRRARIVIMDFDEELLSTDPPEEWIIAECASFGIPLQCLFSRVWHPEGRGNEWEGAFVPIYSLYNVTPHSDLIITIHRFLIRESLYPADDLIQPPPWELALEYFAGFIGDVQSGFTYLEALASPDSEDAAIFRSIEAAFIIAKHIIAAMDVCDLPMEPGNDLRPVIADHLMNHRYDDGPQREAILMAAMLANAAIYDDDFMARQQLADAVAAFFKISPF